MTEHKVFIPETPARRQYKCPGCNKAVIGLRVGNSSSYIIVEADDEKKDHSCNKKTFVVPIELVGYKNPNENKKVKKEEVK